MNRDYRFSCTLLQRMESDRLCVLFHHATDGEPFLSLKPLSLNAGCDAL